MYHILYYFLITFSFLSSVCVSYFVLFYLLLLVSLVAMCVSYSALLPYYFQFSQWPYDVYHMLYYFLTTFSFHSGRMMCIICCIIS